MTTLTMDSPVILAPFIAGQSVVHSTKAGFCITNVNYLGSASSKRRGKRFKQFEVKATSTVEKKEIIFKVSTPVGVSFKKICSNNIMLQSYQLFEDGVLSDEAYLTAGFPDESLEMEYVISIIESLPVYEAIQKGFFYV